MPEAPRVADSQGSVEGAGPWRRDIRAVTLFVEDLPTTKGFYEAVFGLPLVFEDDTSAVFRFENILINLLSLSEAPELIQPAAVASADAGVRMQFTITVDDVDATCAELSRRGVELLNGPIHRPWGNRTASLRDTAGHVWEISH